MKLSEAEGRLNEIEGRKFGELFSTTQLSGIIRAKGKTGQLLELALGLELSSSNLDFEDGELKSNKCDICGNPLETVFITQISGIIDDLLISKRFEKTHLYEKINNILYVPVCKEGEPRSWMFLHSIHVDLTNPRFAGLEEIWRKDYYSICKQLKEHIENDRDGFIHTSNGVQLQIRSKDAKDNKGNYHPIFSTIYKRYVSNKNHAFYFRKSFVDYIRRI